MERSDGKKEEGHDLCSSPSGIEIEAWSTLNRDALEFLDLKSEAPRDMALPSVTGHCQRRRRRGGSARGPGSSSCDSCYNNVHLNNSIQSCPQLL